MKFIGVLAAAALFLQFIVIEAPCESLLLAPKVTYYSHMNDAPLR